MNNQDTRYIYKPVESRKDLQQFNMLINFIKKKKSRTFLFTWHSSDYYVTFSHICTHWAVKCQDKLTELKGEQLSSFSHSYLHHGMMSQACQSVCVTVLFFLPNFNKKFQLGSSKYGEHCNINTDWNLDAQIFQDCYSLLRQMKNTWLDGQMNAYCRSAQIKHIKYKSLYSYYIPH